LEAKERGKETSAEGNRAENGTGFIFSDKYRNGTETEMASRNQVRLLPDRICGSCFGSGYFHILSQLSGI
jgi:hypothetical protein